MNRLLKLQNDVNRTMSQPRQPTLRDFKSGNQPSRRQALAVRYLPIVGCVKRRETGTGIPLLPVEFEGAFAENGSRLDIDQEIFESRTDGKGNFHLLISYLPNIEEKLKNGYVKVNVAGQSALYKVSIIPYSGRGKMELNEFLGSKSISSFFTRLGLQSENQLTRRNQLTSIAIERITIS